MESLHGFIIVMKLHSGTKYLDAINETNVQIVVALYDISSMAGRTLSRLFFLLFSGWLLSSAQLSSALLSWVGGRAAAAVTAVKRWAIDLSDHSYPSSKRGLQANHTQLSRAPPYSTSCTQQHRSHRIAPLPFCVLQAEGTTRHSMETAYVLITAWHAWL